MDHRHRQWRKCARRRLLHPGNPSGGRGDARCQAKRDEHDDVRVRAEEPKIK